MILTTNNDPSVRFDVALARVLTEQCDDVKAYSEAGWFCVIGYKGQKRLVHAHCGSRDEYERIMGFGGPSNPYSGLYR